MLEISNVIFPSNPGSMKPAVTCMVTPKRPILERPSTLATKSSGTLTYSKVVASANSLRGVSQSRRDDLESLCNTYSHYGTYCSLLSALGDRIRSVDGLNGIGPRILEKYIHQGITRNEIQLSTNNPNMLGNIFHDEYIKEEFINNFYCMSLIDMYNELTTSSKLSVLNQRKDRFDNESLIKLNATKFYNYPLTLEAL